MNAEKRDRMKNDGAWTTAHEALSTEVPEHLEKQLQKKLNAFRQDMRAHPYVRKSERHKFSLKRKPLFFSRSWVRPFLWASVGLALVVIVGFLILENKPPTWAEVQERFRSMPFFAASIYVRDVKLADQPPSPLAEPKLVEIWAGYGNRIRIRSGSKVTFADKGEILNTFDLITRSEADTDGVTYKMVNKLGKSNTISLDSILREENPLAPEHIPEWFPKEYFSKEVSPGRLVDTTSLVISNPVASKDVVVFDREFSYFEAKSWRARVWALRESRLPIRVVINVRDDLNGRLVRSPLWDMILTYSKKQPKEFFDPEVFATKLKDPSISVNSLMYMFHQEPGDDSIPLTKTEK